MTAILLFKIIAAPLLICAATLVSRRWGHVVGGWLAGLPLTSGPVSVFFALDHGSLFARQAAEATMGGVAAVIVFAIAYGLASTRGPAVASAIALAAYALSALLVTLIPAGVWWPAAVVLIVVVIGLVAIRESPDTIRSPVPPRWDLPLRMLVAAVMVLLLVQLGQMAGPRLAGLLSPFPVFAGTMMLSLQFTPSEARSLGWRTDDREFCGLRSRFPRSHPHPCHPRSLASLGIDWLTALVVNGISLKALVLGAPER